MGAVPQTNERRPVLISLILEGRLARREVREGRFQRTMALLAAFAAIASGFEAYIQHLRGAFANWLMWTPVLLTPPTVIVATWALFNSRIARTMLPAISLVSLVDGVIGFALHLRGIGRMPGGYRLGQYNVVMGPPIFAPLLVCTVGMMGLLASVLRRERPIELGLLGRPKRPSREGAAEIAGGRLASAIALAAAFLAGLAGGEAYFEHLRGSFNRHLMWTPVWVALPMVATAIGATWGGIVARRLLPFASAATFLAGLLGFALHLRGIRDMPGGFANFHFNITLGPPLFAPLLFTAVGLLGFLATLVRGKEG